MKYIELQEAFELEINQLDNNITKPTTSDIEYWLMAGLDKFIKTRYSGNNTSRRAFEQTQKRIDDLRTLVTRKVYQFTTYPTEQIVTIPSDYMIALGETAVIFSYNTCWPVGPTGQPRTKNTDVIDIPNLTIKDFGKVGEKIVSHYDGLLSKDTPIKSWNVVIPTEEFKKK